MKLKAKIKELTEVDEAFRGLYTKVGDSYELTAVEGVESLSSVTNLVSTTTTQYEALKEKFKNVDPAKYAELVAAETEFKQLQAKIDEAKSSVEQQLTQQFTGEKTKWGTREKQLTDALHEALVVSAATAAISKVAPDSVDLLLPHVVGKMKVVEKDGKFVAKIMGDDGKERVVSVDGKTTDFPIWDEKPESNSLLREMREDKRFMGAFPASDKGGGGAASDTGANTGGAAGVGAAGKTVSISRNAPFEQYKAAREQATKEGATLQLTD